MRVAAVFLFAVLMMPVVLDIDLFTGNHTLITGQIRLSLYGVSFRLPLQILRFEQNGPFYLKAGMLPPIKLHIALKNRKKLPAAVRREMKSWIGNTLFLTDLILGAGNACSAALCCGLLQSVLSLLPNTVSRIMPQYAQAGYFLHVRCISVFRLGKLFLTAAVMLAAKRAGGRAHGNHAEQANQLRHADGP